MKNNEVFFEVKESVKGVAEGTVLEFIGFLKPKGPRDPKNPRPCKFLFLTEDGFPIMLDYNHIRKSDKVIEQPKELKPGCIVECIQPESELYMERLVVEAVEGLTIIVKTEGGEIMKMDIFSIKVV